MTLKFKKLHPEAVIPCYAKPGDAGLDLTAISYSYEKGRHIYGTGIAVEIPENHVGLIFPRSSICKKDLRLTNSVGVIDSGYRGEIKFFFENDNMVGREEYEVCHFWGMLDGHETVIDTPAYRPGIYKIGDRIGQLLVIPYPRVEIVEVENLSSSERGEGGFGSTGV